MLKTTDIQNILPLIFDCFSQLQAAADVITGLETDKKNILLNALISSLRVEVETQIKNDCLMIFPMNLIHETIPFLLNFHQKI